MVLPHLINQTITVHHNHYNGIRHPEGRKLLELKLLSFPAGPICQEEEPVPVNGLKRSVHLLCDGLRFIWAQRIVDGHEVVGTVVLHVEEREGEKYDIFFWSSDLPLTARPGGVFLRVPRRWEILLIYFGLQTKETVLWEQQRGWDGVGSGILFIQTLCSFSYKLVDKQNKPKKLNFHSAKVLKDSNPSDISEYFVGSFFLCDVNVCKERLM